MAHGLGGQNRRGAYGLLVRAISRNARFGEDGKIVRTGEQVVLGSNDKYAALCRKHYHEGNFGIEEKR